MMQSADVVGSSAIGSAGNSAYELFEFVLPDIPNPMSLSDNTNKNEIKQTVRVFGYGINLI